MKKSFFKKVMILCFALFGMVMIGNNVFATDPNDGEDPGDDSGGGGREVTCYGRGLIGSVGYFYCDGISKCYWVRNANADDYTPSSKCTPKK